MNSELRKRIYSLHQSLLNQTRDDGSKRNILEVSRLTEDFMSALDELDAMAERDALWGKMERYGVGTSMTRNGEWRAKVCPCDHVPNATPGLAVAVLNCIAKIEEEK